MRFIETPIAGAWVIEVEQAADERGSFARLADRDEFSRRGLIVPSTQWSVSFNHTRATLRGMHYQAEPHEEVKLVRCTAGQVFDVIVDIRTRRWFGIELSAENRRALYIPAGMAHGFVTLVDGTEMFYAIEGEYAPAAARGIRWNDPAVAIQWPLTADIISDRDRSFPLLDA
jgi:dTDP-4-dehydrorhamnose 3,5-epimerase